MNSGMLFWFQMIVLSLAMVVANCQCLVACMEAPAQHETQPPCHQHQQKSTSCGHATFVADLKTPGVNVERQTQPVSLAQPIALSVPLPLSDIERSHGTAFALTPPAQLRIILRV